MATVTKDDVVEALHSVEDPELGMDIVELGLFYDTEIEGERVKIIHSLTSMGCPAGPMIQENIHDAVASLPGVEQVEVELTFEPPWTPDRMSDDAKFILGFGYGIAARRLTEAMGHSSLELTYVGQGDGRGRS
jgi:metal-sulfur cluster biosynthetic enzyme